MWHHSGTTWCVCVCVCVCACVCMCMHHAATTVGTKRWLFLIRPGNLVLSQTVLPDAPTHAQWKHTDSHTLQTYMCRSSTYCNFKEGHLRSLLHTHMHAHICIRTCLKTHRRTHIHTTDGRVQPVVEIVSLVNSQPSKTHTHTHMHTHMHTYTCMKTRRRTHTHTHTRQTDGWPSCG